MNVFSLARFFTIDLTSTIMQMPFNFSTVQLRWTLDMSMHVLGAPVFSCRRGCMSGLMIRTLCFRRYLTN